MKVNHVGYLVDDLDMACDKMKLLGFSVEAPSFFVKDRNQWNLFMTNGLERVELVMPVKTDENEDDTNNSSKANAGNIGSTLNGGTGPYHICFESDDFDADRKSLKKQGFLPISKVENEPAFGGKKLQFFYNSHIGIVELVQGKFTLEYSTRNI